MIILIMIKDISANKILIQVVANTTEGSVIYKIDNAPANN